LNKNTAGDPEVRLNHLHDAQARIQAEIAEIKRRSTVTTARGLHFMGA
jgi:hypothetical protein